jgi:hypothetical protein
MDCRATVGLLLLLLLLVLVVVCSSVVLQLVSCKGGAQGKRHWKKMMKVLVQQLLQGVRVLQNQRMSAAQLQSAVCHLHKQQQQHQLMMTAAV